MKIAIFSSKNYEAESLTRAAANTPCQLHFFSEHLDIKTVALAQQAFAVCCFVSDDLDAGVLKSLSELGVKLVALRTAGFDHVDLQAAHDYGLSVVRVPAYSPDAIAEFSMGLLLGLQRKLFLSNQRSHEYNFSLEGLQGANLYGKTVGVIGTGNIGRAFVRMLSGFNCRVVAYDPVQSPQCIAMGAEYVRLEQLFQCADTISLHCSLNDSTQHMINHESLALMKQGVTIINTGRGGLVDTQAVLTGLHNGKIAALGLDVYEFEKALFFEDHRKHPDTDPMLSELMSLDNVVVTGHLAYCSYEALDAIATTTITNICAFAAGSACNLVSH